MDHSEQRLIKIVTVGESGVGKTALITRYTDDLFNFNHMATLAIDFKFKLLTVKGSKLKLQIWDTAGQERFNSLAGNFIRGEIIRLSRRNHLLFGRRYQFLRTS